MKRAFAVLLRHPKSDVQRSIVDSDIPGVRGTEKHYCRAIYKSNLSQIKSQFLRLRSGWRQRLFNFRNILASETTAKIHRNKFGVFVIRRNLEHVLRTP